MEYNIKDEAEYLNIQRVSSPMVRAIKAETIKKIIIMTCIVLVRKETRTTKYVFKNVRDRVYVPPGNRDGAGNKVGSSRVEDMLTIVFQQVESTV